MNPAQLSQWIAVAQAAVPLVKNGLLAATAIAELFKSSNPTATIEETNVLLRAVLAQSLSEQELIKAELARLAAKAEVALSPQPQP